MTSPDDVDKLEQRLIRVLRAHGDSVEPSPDAYARLARVVEATSAGSRWMPGVLGPRRGGGNRIDVSGDFLRPLAFVTAVLAVAGLGGYGLMSLASSPAETATAAPATADVSDLVVRDESSTETEAAAVEADRIDDAESTSSDARMADGTDGSPRSSVPSDSAAAGATSAGAGNSAEQFAGLTYSPVRATRLEAAQAFLDLLEIDDVELEDRGDRVLIRSKEGSAGTATPILTTLTIEATGDAFMVVDARSDRLELSIDNATTADPTADDITDDAVVTGPIDLSGTTDTPPTEVTVVLRSVADGSLLGRWSASPEPAGGERAGYRLTVPVTGAERVWVVATATGPDDDDVLSVAARPLLYTGRPDPASYTVVGIGPDDPDGGLVVRSAPDGQPIGIIELGSTGIRRRPVPPRVVDGVIWWAVDDATGLEGWAAARYLAVDESPAEAAMVELARSVIEAVTAGDPAPVEGIGLSRPVFVGSIVDPRPVSGLADVRGLLTTRRRIANGGGGGPGALADFYGFDRWGDAEVFVPRGYREDGAAESARAFFGDLSSVVIRSPNPGTGGWERVHLFVSRDGDRPTLVGMVVEAEPLPDGAGASGEPATSSRPDPDD